jgi:hypothetical protein
MTAADMDAVNLFPPTSRNQGDLAITLAHPTSIGGILARQTPGRLAVSGNVFTHNPDRKPPVHLEDLADVTVARLDNIPITNAPPMPEPCAT